MLLSDKIASFIDEMLDDCGGTLEIKRNDLAKKLGCVPSQINYVVTSRFTPERGYIIESRRGGGGYIRIVRREIGTDGFLQQAFAAVGNDMSEHDMRAALDALYIADLITSREKRIIRSCLSASALSALPRETQNAARASAYRGFLLALMK